MPLWQNIPGPKSPVPAIATGGCLQIFTELPTKNAQFLPIDASRCLRSSPDLVDKMLESGPVRGKKISSREVVSAPPRRSWCVSQARTKAVTGSRGNVALVQRRKTWLYWAGNCIRACKRDCRPALAQAKGWHKSHKNSKTKKDSAGKIFLVPRFGSGGALVESQNRS